MIGGRIDELVAAMDRAEERHAALLAKFGRFD